MKRLIGILIGLATLTSVDAVLGRESAGGASGGRHASGGFAGAHAGKHGGRPGVHHGLRPGVHHGHRPGVHHGQHHHRPTVVFRPGWWWHHNRVVYGSTVVVAAPFFYPVYVPVPAPVYVEQSSDLRYYCPDYRDYYPNVATCPSQWMQVIPGAVGTTN